MELTIFTGLNSGARFYDCFTDGDGFNPSEYADCVKHYFELAEIELQALASDKIADLDSFSACLKGVYIKDLHKFIHGLYNSTIEREVITDLVLDKIEALVIEEWKQDCLECVISKYNYTKWGNDE